ncbi:CPBP family intramembrane metalloprotease [Flavobacterium columnare]|uniref:CPBP family intramembrane metalloprotease n=1 Tax=Flavobacterium columnare TaxID=996 RepID=A0A437UBH6_9FLAO|nr:CPBP family intramembrane metalloprotease [Flavobacterium columnare]
MKRLYFRFFLFLTIAILNGYIFNFLIKIFELKNLNNSGNDLENFSKFSKFLIIVIVAPFIETLIFQYLPLKVLERFKIENRFLLIIIPSLIFSLIHPYHYIYILMTFFGGIILNSYYQISKNNNKYYFFLTTLLHSMYNLFGFLFVA